MRIAISGAHCSGKTTLIEEFLSAHPNFAHEPEPYTVMVEEHGEDFAAEPGADDFYRQLELDVDRLRCYQAADRVIFERSPVDFLAYMLALRDLGRDHDNSDIIERALGIVMGAVRKLDVIVFLPIDDGGGIEISSQEDPQLRVAVDSLLTAILRDDAFDFFSSANPLVVEARGSFAQRLRTLDRMVGMIDDCVIE